MFQKYFHPTPILKPHSTLQLSALPGLGVLQGTLSAQACFNTHSGTTEVTEHISNDSNKTATLLSKRDVWEGMVDEATAGGVACTPHPPVSSPVGMRRQ